jgi:hypothetical protein
MHVNNLTLFYISILLYLNQVYGFDVVWTALVRYKELHGDLTISQRFSVPPDSPEWPQAVWNMKLGEEHSIEYSAEYSEEQSQEYS